MPGDMVGMGGGEAEAESGNSQEKGNERPIRLSDMLALFFNGSDADYGNAEGTTILLTPSHIHSEVSERGVKRGIQRLAKREAAGSQEEQAKGYMNSMKTHFRNMDGGAERVFSVLFTEHNIVSTYRLEPDRDSRKDGESEKIPIYSAEVTTHFGDFIVYSPGQNGIAELINHRHGDKETIIGLLYKILEEGGTIILAHPAFVPPNGNRTWLGEASPEAIENYKPYELLTGLVDRITGDGDGSSREEILKKLRRIGIEVYNATRPYETHLNLAFAVMVDGYVRERIGKDANGNWRDGTADSWLITPVAGSDSHTGRGKTYLELVLEPRGREDGYTISPGESYVIASDPREPLTRQYFRKVLEDERYTFRLPGFLNGMERFGRMMAYIMELAMSVGASFSPRKMAYAFKRNGECRPNGGIEEFVKFTKQYGTYISGYRARNGKE